MLGSIIMIAAAKLNCGAEFVWMVREVFEFVTSATAKSYLYLISERYVITE